MAHTISKQIYCEQEKKYITCEVLVFDEQEDVPETDRREIVLSCQECGTGQYYGGEASDMEYRPEIEDSYQETELIDQYSDLDVDKTGY